MKPYRSEEPWLHRWWRGEGGAMGLALSAISLPLAGLYSLGQALRSQAYQRGLLRTLQAPIPVVSVGNLVAGGTGKTPVASWVARRLKEKGARPAILLRGYGRDEVLLHRRWIPEVSLMVGSDRHLLAQEAARQGAEVAVLDDGFQHRRLARDLDLVLLAAEHPFPGRSLPLGPYRESAGALVRAGLVVLTRRTASDEMVDARLRQLQERAPGRSGVVLRLAPSGWTTLPGTSADPPRGPLLAVTSVAGPMAFRDMVSEHMGQPVSLLAFPDHHDYLAAELQRIVRVSQGRIIVTTEKDAVKLAPLGVLPDTTRVLALSVEVEKGARLLDEALDRLLAISTMGSATSGEPDQHGDGQPQVRAGEGREER